MDHSWKPLKNGDFRLLRLESGRFQDTLYASLEVYNEKRVLGHVGFDALSYAWGEGQPSVELSIFGEYEVQYPVKQRPAWLRDSVAARGNFVPMENVPDEVKAPQQWMLRDTSKTTQIKITGNLNAALRHLRYTEQVRLLWVDQICID